MTSRAIDFMPREVLEKKSTKRLLAILKAVRLHIATLHSWPDFCFPGSDIFNITKQTEYMELIKSVLATREHVERKKSA